MAIEFLRLNRLTVLVLQSLADVIDEIIPFDAIELRVRSVGDSPGEESAFPYGGCVVEMASSMNASETSILRIYSTNPDSIDIEDWIDVGLSDGTQYELMLGGRTTPTGEPAFLERLRQLARKVITGALEDETDTHYEPYRREGVTDGGRN